MNYNQNHIRLVFPVKDHELYSQKPLKIYWKPLFEINLFGSKQNMNYQIKFTLYLHSSYQSLFTPEMKYLIRGNVRLGKCDLGNCLSGKCLRRTVRL